mgnify:CR=1 FL=1
MVIANPDFWLSKVYKIPCLYIVDTLPCITVAAYSGSGDRFFLIATDLCIAADGDWWKAQTEGSRSIMIWESEDLVHWSEQRMVEVNKKTAGCTWAPEAYYDEVTGEYLVFWASRVSSDGYARQRVYAACHNIIANPTILVKQKHIVFTLLYIFCIQGKGEYLVFWASRVSSDGYARQRVYYVKTRDFVNFRSPSAERSRNGSLSPFVPSSETSTGLR